MLLVSTSYHLTFAKCTICTMLMAQIARNALRMIPSQRQSLKSSFPSLSQQFTGIFFCVILTTQATLQTKASTAALGFGSWPALVCASFFSSAVDFGAMECMLCNLAWQGRLGGWPASFIALTLMVASSVRSWASSGRDHSSNKQHYEREHLQRRWALATGQPLPLQSQASCQLAGRLGLAALLVGCLATLGWAGSLDG